LKNNIYSVELETASPKNRHCANYIGTLSFPITGNCRRQYSRDVFVVPGAAALQHAAEQAEHQTRQDRWHSDGADDTHPVRRRTHGYLPRRRPVVVKQDKIVGIQTALTTHGQCDAGLTVTFPDADPLSAFRRR